MARITIDNLRHAAGMLRFGRNPAAAVYDSIGSDFFLALDDGWLNLGLWEGDGSDPAEAPVAVRRLVGRMAADLPRDGDILDVGNGLAAQDLVIAEVSRGAQPDRAQHHAGPSCGPGASAWPRPARTAVNGDACRMPFPAASFDGVISVEAAFHFPSRASFFAEAFRVLRPGGVLTFSDVPVRRMPDVASRGARRRRDAPALGHPAACGGHARRRSRTRCGPRASSMSAHRSRARA